MRRPVAASATTETVVELTGISVHSPSPRVVLTDVSCVMVVPPPVLRIVTVPAGAAEMRAPWKLLNCSVVCTGVVPVSVTASLTASPLSSTPYTVTICVSVLSDETSSIAAAAA